MMSSRTRPGRARPPLFCLIAVLLIVSGCAAQSYDVEEAVADISALQTQAVADGVVAPQSQEQLAQPAESAPTAQPTAAPVESEPDAAPAAAEDTFQAGQLATMQGRFFAGAGVCAACHTRLQDAAGNNVSNDALWRPTMMANAARDPYWQAEVRAEVLENPHLSEIIQDKCATCHMPMARQTATANEDPTLVLDEGFLNPDHPLHELAMDGVSCTQCHQIEADGFGTVESFSGHYAIDLTLPQGERVNYGPFIVNEQNTTIMQAASGFSPTQGTHIQQSEQCATCHTLWTPYVDAAGEVVGEFPEQMPYLEWRNSSYADSQSCQGCHMPTAEGEVVLSNTGGPPREPVRRHDFAGGSNTMLTIFRQQGAQMDLAAGSDHFDAALTRMETQLQNRTATLAIRDAARSDDTLTAQIHISSMVGHKLPSAFPSRRVWLHITVLDAEGSVVFESGAVDAQGAIAGNDNDVDGTTFEPHHDTISSPDDVQIYEAIMANTDGEVTTTLIRAASYLKDNRLLPAGFDSAGADDAVAVYGAAREDATFTGGSDVVTLAAPVGDAPGPLTVQVELLYQSIAYRWAENLRAYDAAEPTRFIQLWEQTQPAPITVATATRDVE